jgi:hypothetical protein
MYLAAPRWRGTSALVLPRSAARIRGLGQTATLDLSSADPTLVPCSSVTLPAGFVGPVNCDPTNGGPSYPASQAQLSAAYSSLAAQVQATAAPSWVLPAALAAGGLVLAMVFLKAAR